MDTDKRVIDLSCYPDITQDHGLLLFELPTGVVWTNQTAGVMCYHPHIEGIAVPIRIPEELAVITENWCGIDDEGADTLDKLFSEYGVPLEVDRDWQDDSTEAWIYVKICQDPEEEPDLYTKQSALSEYFGMFSAFKNLKGLTAVLTYLNSD